MENQPELKTRQLIDQIMPLRFMPPAYEEVDPNDIRLLKVQREANSSLKQSHPADAYMVLGIVACLQRQIDDMRSYHEKSLLFDPTSQEALYNYFVSLALTGFKNEAKEKLIYVNDMYPGQPGILKSLCQVSVDLGQLTEARRYLSQLEKLHKEAEYIAETKPFLDSCLAFLSSSNLTDDDISTPVTHIQSFLQSKQIYSFIHDHTLLEDDGSQFFFVEFILPTKFENQITQLNNELDSYLVDHLSNAHPDVFSYALISPE